MYFCDFLNNFLNSQCQKIKLRLFRIYEILFLDVILCVSVGFCFLLSQNILNIFPELPMFFCYFGIEFNIILKYILFSLCTMQLLLELPFFVFFPCSLCMYFFMIIWATWTTYFCRLYEIYFVLKTYYKNLPN